MTYPITTTLNRIWSHVPNEEGKARILAAVGKDSPDDEPITFATIVDSVGLFPALRCCRAEPQYASEWRLFAVWCARQVQHLMDDKRSLASLDVAERYANGQATDQELASAYAAADAAADAAASAARLAVADAAYAAAYADSSAAGAAQRDAFKQLVETGTLPQLKVFNEEVL